MIPILLTMAISDPIIPPTVLGDATFTYEAQINSKQIHHSRYIRRRETDALISKGTPTPYVFKVQASPRGNRWDFQGDRILVAFQHKPTIFEQKDKDYIAYDMSDYLSIDEKLLKKNYKKNNLPFPPKECINFETIKLDDEYVIGVRCEVMEFRNPRESFVFYFASDFKWALNGFDPAIFGEFMFPWPFSGSEPYTDLFYRNIWKVVKTNQGPPLKIVHQQRKFTKIQESMYESIFEATIEATNFYFSPHKKPIDEINPTSTWFNANGALKILLAE